MVLVVLKTWATHLEEQAVLQVVQLVLLGQPTRRSVVQVVGAEEEGHLEGPLAQVGQGEHRGPGVPEAAQERMVKLGLVE